MKWIVWEDYIKTAQQDQLCPNWKPAPENQEWSQKLNTLSPQRLFFANLSATELASLGIFLHKTSRCSFTISVTPLTKWCSGCLKSFPTMIRIHLNYEISKAFPLIFPSLTYTPISPWVMDARSIKRPMLMYVRWSNWEYTLSPHLSVRVFIWWEPTNLCL